VQYGKVKGLGGDILGIPLKSQVESVEIEASWDKQCLALLKGEDTASESVEEKVEKDMAQWLEREGRTIDTVLELAKVQSVELVEEIGLACLLGVYCTRKESFSATLFKAEMRQIACADLRKKPLRYHHSRLSWTRCLKLSKMWSVNQP
jgi:hypothetical protein